MLPVYRQMNSYPHQSNQVPFTQCYIPTSENLPQHQSGPNPPNFPTMYMPWPHGSNYMHPTPCHACCSHNGFPGGYYTVSPPCPHLIMAPPFNCNHSAFPQAYPVRYDPPLQYSAVQPRYEYDKSVHRDSHCCGCPNHTGSQKEDRSVEIEEMDTSTGTKGSNSLIPVQLGNHPYQVVWVSPELLKKNELGGLEKVPSEVKLPEISKPLHHEQNGDRKKLQNKQEEDSQRKFSFPLIWMPYDMQKEVGENDNKAKDEGREMSKIPSSKQVEEPSPTFKVLPLKPGDSHEKMGKPNSGDGKPVEKNGGQKSIPVKQLGQHEENVSEGGKRVIEVPVKHTEDGVNKSSESNVKKQTSAPSKTAKLPPVCLRVDPLPRKKNSNGSSKSPSPPDQKRRAEAANDSSGVHVLPKSKDKTKQALDSKEMKPNRKEGRTIQVMDGPPVEDKKAELKTDADLKNVANLPNESYKEASASTTTEKTEEDGNGSKSGDEKSERVLEKAAEAPIEVEQQMDISKSACGEHETQNKRNLTEAEAAVLIQSLYRGFEVRRWDPLKKLKQIAEVRAQLADVRNHIEALESSEDMLKDNKQMAGVGETIMRLLLKLDSIQGLYPSLREIRKSLARELVTLQEKLDSLMAEKSRKCTEEAATSGLAQHDTIIEVGVKEVQNQGLEETSCRSSGNNSVHDVDFPNPQCDTHESSVRSENGSELHMEQMEKADMEGRGVSEVAGSERGDFVGTGQELPVQLPSTAEKNNSSEEIIMEGVAEKLSGDLNGEIINELEESVQEVISEKPAIVSKMEEQTEVEEKESLVTRRMDGEAPADPLLNDLDFPAEVGHPKHTESDAEMIVLEELPFGAAEADSLEPPYDKCEQVLQAAVVSDLAVPKSESHEQVASEKRDILSGEGDHCNTVSDTSSPLKEECSGQQAPEIADIVESNDGLKVGTPESNEPLRDTALQEEEAQQELAEQQMKSPPGGSGSQQDENHGSIGDTQLEFGGGGLATQEMVAPDGEVKQFDDMKNRYQEPASCEHEEEEQMEKMDPQEAGSDGLIEQGEIECAHESSEHDLLVETKPTSAAADHQEDKEDEEHQDKEEAESEHHQEEKVDAELLPLAKKPMDMDTGSDKRLIEENEKLRELMAKLMETGKEQLSVISDLTGRVKDLEKKLAKKKKLRTMRRHRGAASCKATHV